MKPIRSTLNSVDMRMMMVSLPHSSVRSRFDLIRSNRVYNTVCVELWNIVNEMTEFSFVVREKVKNETSRF